MTRLCDVDDSKIVGFPKATAAVSVAVLKCSVFFLAFVPIHTDAEMCVVNWGRGAAMRQFSVGEVVTWIPDLFLRRETRGDYRIVATMPDRDGQHMYRIKSPLEEYERAVKEDVLAKSDGYLPEQVPARVSRRSSVAPPILQVA